MSGSRRLQWICGPRREALIEFRPHRWASSAQAARVGGKSVSILRRIAWARIGAAPSEETPITTGERLTIEPNWKSEKPGLSITLAGTPARRAAA